MFGFSAKLLPSLLGCGFAAVSAAAGVPQVDIMADTWVGEDALGRRMPTIAEAGPVKGGHRREVGIFYITWHTLHSTRAKKPYAGDVTRILGKAPRARLDGKHPLWTEGEYHWGEPESGYFTNHDRWLVRHDMSMLADAGVDVVVFDVTNAEMYWDEWDFVLDEMEAMGREGNKVPKFCFWSFNGDVVKVVTEIYDRYYRTPRHSGLWYRRDGKPLLLYNSNPKFTADGDVSARKGISFSYPKEILEFFSLRNMWWGYYEWAGKRYAGGEDNWCFGYSMADRRVRDLGARGRASRHRGVLEEYAVTPAQHPVSMQDEPIGVGKSWTLAGGEPELDERDMPVNGASGKGLYFQERWNEAIEADPEFVFVNDWNEWTAGKYPANQVWLRRKSNFFFVDQYNAEFNRTVQPMKGGYTDNYYMQMVANIRRYKGVRATPVDTGGGCDYYDTIGDTVHRDAPGYGGVRYVDKSGRNDIVRIHVATVGGRTTFSVDCAAPLSPPSDRNWMVLLVNGKRFDYASDPACRFNVDGSRLVISIPADRLGRSFDFKFSDNAADLSDPISIATTGDTAPNRRFSYRYQHR